MILFLINNINKIIINFKKRFNIYNLKIQKRVQIIVINIFFKNKILNIKYYYFNILI